MLHAIVRSSGSAEFSVGIFDLKRSFETVVFRFEGDFRNIMKHYFADHERGVMCWHIAI